MNWGVFGTVLLTGWVLAALVQIAGQNRTTTVVVGGIPTILSTSRSACRSWDCLT